MLRDKDYNRINKLINYTYNLDPETKCTINAYLNEIPEASVINFKDKTIDLPSLKEQVKNNKLFEDFINVDTDNIPLDVYLFLYANKIRTEGKEDYKQQIAMIKASSLYQAIPQIHEELEFSYLTQCLMTSNISWNEFTQTFDANDWHEIYLLAEVLPVSNASLTEFIKWISLIVETQARDGALGGIAQYIYEWVILNEKVSVEIDLRLIEISTNASINRFFTPLLKGMKEKQNRNSEYYILRLRDHITTVNSFNILYAVGTISLNNEESVDRFYCLLTEKLSENKLKLHDFINLCNYFNLYKKELFANIESVLPTSEEPDTLFAVIGLLQNDEQDKINQDWKRQTCALLFSKKVTAITSALDHFLYGIANNNLPLCYDLLEFRFKIMAHMELLESALIQIVQKDIFLFQSKLIAWINSEDIYLHTAVRKVCSLHELGKSLFDIPAVIFEGYTTRDKLYISYKIVGCVYSMEALQRLILSLIRSIKDENEITGESMHYILSEYLVYNYRSTLELIKKGLEKDDLGNFARQLYEQIVEEYETYFTNLTNISVDKELRPYREHLLLKNFYMRKLYSNIPKEAKRSSIADFFRNTQLNSNRWAMRRPDELKHKVQELGHISVSTEFPSGEYLNPIYQEYIRRTYQNIKKDEINTD